MLAQLYAGAHKDRVLSLFLSNTALAASATISGATSGRCTLVAQEREQPTAKRPIGRRARGKDARSRPPVSLRGHRVSELTSDERRELLVENAGLLHERFDASSLSPSPVVGGI